MSVAYANRTVDFEEVIHLLNLADRPPIALNAAPKSGLSSFLDELQTRIPERELIHVRMRDGISFRAALKRSALDATRRLNEAGVVGRIPWTEFADATGDVFLASRVSPAGALVKLIAAMLPSRDKKLYAGERERTSDSAIFEYFRDGPEKIVAIDKAQFLDEGDLPIVEALINTNDPVTCILAFTSQDGDRDKVLCLLASGTDKCCESHQFKDVSPFLVREIAEKAGCHIDEKTANKVCEESGGDIYKVMQAIAGSWPEPVKYPDAKRNTLIYLDMWPSGLRESELVELTSMLPVHCDARDYTREILDELMREGWIVQLTESPAGDYRYLLAADGFPDVIDSCGKADELFCARNLVQTIDVASIDFDEATNLFHLAVKAESKSSARLAAHRLLELSLSEGGAVPNEALKQTDDDDSLAFAKAVYHCRERDYVTALRYAERVPADLRSDDYVRFMGILMNRTRKHKQASELLSACIAEEQDQALRNILIAVEIANDLHSEKTDEARERARNLVNDCLNHRHGGYVARNSTSLFGMDDSLLLLEKALENFEAHDDAFGFASTLVNRAVKLIAAGKYALAGDDLDKAKTIIAEMRSVHHYPLDNAYGLLSFAQGNYHLARRHFERALANAKDQLPAIQTSINIALASARIGEVDFALKRLEALSQLVAECPVDRAKQLYYPRLLVVKYLAQKVIDSNALALTRCHPDRYHPDKTSAILKAFDEAESAKTPDVDDHALQITPCKVVYWYVNPLLVLSHFPL